MTTTTALEKAKAATAPAAPLGATETFERFLRLNVAQGQASPETLRAYRAGVCDFVRWIGLDRAGAASLEDVEAYRAHLIREGKAKRTIAARLAAVRVFYRAAQRWGLRRDNPAEGVKAPAAREAPEDRISFLPLAGLRTLLELPDVSTPSGLQARAVLVLMAVHGLRVSEVAGLRLKDLESGAENPTLRVRGKGSKARTVYLTPETAEVLTAWLGAREGVALGDTEALFVAQDRRTRGTALGARALRNTVDNYLDRAGLKRAGVSCHSLRHSAATWSLHAGASLQAIAGMLGHSSTRTTETYARLVDRVRSNPARYLWGALKDTG